MPHADTAGMLRLQALLDAMPPVRALGLRVDHLGAERIRLAAPLARNFNDKGCAFGGSLASILTLAAWGALEVALHRAGEDVDLYIADSRLEYLAPLYDELQAEAGLPDAETLATLRAKLAARGRGGLTMQAEARDASGRLVARLEGRYAAVRRD
ncbi:MAG: YiiD C-terminal domain-containing protein [Xanthomonadaceae bacterium]|jgi:thioesterase domain-containing protein|nr:YiiD C-terminal domain-containing protein [Xanthomonadaceae bacterium]